MSGWRLEGGGPTVRLWIDRTEKKNAISLPMWAALPGVLEQAAALPGARLLVLRGVGGVFSGGADIEEFRSAYASREAALANHATMQAAMSALETFPLPSVAVLEGPAIGAGLGLALACDLRLASPEALFAITPAKLGLLYALSDIRRLVEAVGWSKAKLLLFTARRIEAATAERWGLIDLLAEDVEAELAHLTQELAAAAPCTRQGLKRLFGLLRAGEREENQESRALFAEAFGGPDFAEGYLAFKQRRPPRFP